MEKSKSLTVMLRVSPKVRTYLEENRLYKDEKLNSILERLLGIDILD